MTYATKLRLLWLSSHFTVLYSFLNVTSLTIWLSIAWAIAVVVIGGYAGWHRYFIHNSYQTGRIRRFILLWLGAIQGIGKPLTICAIHRWHHANSDTEEDVHSPTSLKWWQILLGFYKEPKLHRRLIKDLIQDNNIKFCQKHYFKIIIAINLLLLIIDPVLPGLIMGTVNLYAFYTTGILINWLNHLGGKPNNNIISAILTLGEGLHKNHHDDSKRYSNHVKWYHLDPTGWIIKYFLRINNA
jgi:stearoyl-CoA desaturase (delta-9 desaturase)